MGNRDSTGFLHQLRLLLWKNFTIKKRSPIVFLLEVFIPLVLFLILVLTRKTQHTRPYHIVKFGSRPLPSAGFIPILQSFCDHSSDHSHSQIAQFLQLVQDILNKGSYAKYYLDRQSKRLDDNITGHFHGFIQEVKQSEGIVLGDIMTNLSAVVLSFEKDFNIPAEDASTLLKSSINLTKLTDLAEDMLQPGAEGNWSERVEQLAQVIQSSMSDQNPESLEKVLSVLSMLILSAQTPDSILKNIVLKPSVIRLLSCHPDLDMWLIPEANTDTATITSVLHQICQMDDASLEQMGELLWSQINSTTLLSKLNMPPPVKDSILTGWKTFQQLVQSIQHFIKTISGFIGHLPNKQPNCVYHTVKAANTTPTRDYQNHTKREMATANFWASVSPILCGDGRKRRSTPDDEHPHIPLDLELAGMHMIRTRLSMFLYSNPRILYTPNNTLTVTVIKKLNETFKTFANIGTFAKQWMDTSRSVRRSLLPTASSAIHQALNGSRLPFHDDLQPVLKLVSALNMTSGENETLHRGLNLLDNAACTWLNLIEEINFDFFHGFETEKDLEDYFLEKQYKDNVTVVAGLVFENFNSTMKELPPHVRYKIRQNATLTPSTKLARSSIWFPSPGTIEYNYYEFGFVWLQDLIDRTIIDLQAGRPVVEPASTLQRMPYPCWRSDNFIWLIQHILPLLLMLSWIYSVAMLVQRIVYEKERRLKEVMKMMGLSYGVHWCAWFVTAFVQMTLTVIALTLMLRYGLVLPHSNPWIVFVFLELFAISSIGFSFLISSFYSKAKLAAACAGIFYFLTYVPYTYISIKQDLGETFISATIKTVMSLFATTSLGLGGKYFLFYEMEGTGVQWNNIRQSPVEHDHYSLFLVFLMMTIDTFLYMLLAWYIENVHPGTYGLPKPWYFPFIKTYWTTGVVNPIDWRSVFRLGRRKDYSRLSVTEDDQAGVISDDLKELSDRFESDPNDVEIGVSIRRLTKIYSKGDQPALDNLNLNLYEGQITSYLGHNGAGKTTTMSVLTGMFPATSGHALIYGDDTRTDMDVIRQNLGMCPQHNVLFDSLTVEEHLWFYSRLKGMKKTDIKEELDRMLKDLGLIEKRQYLTTCLSGGMQRKLSVAIAFVGGSRTVILDEPTAGIDPYSRRSIWDLLQKYKSGRTILLSTHHMDEAEILGDRIAVISLGRLKCYGSPMYLKSVLGDGHHLHILKEITGNNEGTENGNSIVREVKRFHETARLVSETKDEVHIVLPLNSGKKSNLSELFAMLEDQKGSLGVANFGITESTLEEVLVRVTKPDLALDNKIPHEFNGPRTATDPCDQQAELHEFAELTDPELGYDSSHAGRRQRRQWQSEDTGHESNSATDCENGSGTYKLESHLLMLNHFRALIMKRFRYIYRNRKALVSQVILPAVFVSIAMTVALSAPKDDDPPPMDMSTSQYFNLTQPRGNFIPYANRYTSTRAQYYERDAGPGELIKTFRLPSGVGATCVLKKPFHSQYDKEALRKLQRLNYSAHSFQLFSKYFQSDCAKVFAPGIQLANYVPHASVTHQKLNISAENETWEAVPTYYPVCQCMKDGVGFLCPDSGYVNPPQFEVVTRDILQDITGTDETEFYLYTTDHYRLHRYGGFTFGTEYAYVPDTYGLGSEVRNVMKQMAVHGTTKIWVNKKGYHSVPVFLNAMNNIILRANLPANKGNPAAYGITTINHPMKSTNNILSEDYISGGTDVIMAIFIIVAMAFVPASFVLFLVHERSIKAKHLQFVSGVHPVMYWVSNYFWDMCNYVIPAVCIIGILLAFNIPSYVAPGNIQAVVALFFLYGWSITPMMYPASFIFKEPSVAYILLIVANLFTGITCVVTSFMMELFNFDQKLDTMQHLLSNVFLIFPNYCLGNGLMTIALNQYKNEYYSHTGQYGKMRSAMEWDLTAKKLVVMAISGVVFFVFTILCEYRFFIRCRSIPSVEQNKEITDEDTDVQSERRRIRNHHGKKDILHLENLTKIYKTRKLGTVLAVDRLCLGIQKGECFGLLGVNGAGKTTTFKMLTGDTRPSSGSAFVNSYCVSEKLEKVHQNIGYCPQFDALFDDLTGRELLLMYARMRGVPPSQESRVVSWAIHKLSLSRYADRTAGTYSGGNKRKLSTAIALMGNPPLIYMDEPTTGMDPYSRRFLWDVIRDLVREGKSILFTSHSMEECEALCTRLSIMVNGRLQCLGSIQHLKEKYGGGYTISVQLKNVTRLSTLRQFIQTSIPGVIFTENRYKTLIFQAELLQISLSEMFRCLEEVKDRFDLEDFSVSQNTLDNVFISFAVKQKELAKHLEDDQQMSTPDGEDTHIAGADLYDEPLIQLVPRTSSSSRSDADDADADDDDDDLLLV